MNKEQLTLFEGGAQLGKQLRDVGIARVEQSNATWYDLVLTSLRQYLAVNEHVTGDEFRLHWLKHSGPAPTHPNAWGGIWCAAAKHGWIHDSGRTAPMMDPKSHGRKTTIWRSLVYVGDK
jgi:hypothetical protein